MTEIYFVSGMFCGSCAKAVEGRIRGLAGVSSATVNFASRLLRVEFEPSADLASLRSEIEESVRQGGFVAQLQKAGWLPSFLDRLRDEHARAIPAWLLGLVFFFAMWSSTIAFAGYLGELEAQEKWFLAALSATLGLPALFLGGWPFTKAGLRSLFRARTLTLDLFIALGAVCAAVFSLHNVISGSSQSYVDSAGMVLSLLLGAKIAEARLADRMASTILASIHGDDPAVERLEPGVATRKTASQIRRQDLVAFAPGETVLFDGRLESDTAQIDAHLLDGESSLHSLKRGDFINAGSIARSALSLRVQEPVGSRAIDGWAETALSAAVRPHRYSRLLVWLESRLTLVALSASVLLGGLTYARTAELQLSLETFFIGVLIFCPCLFASILPYSKQLVHLALARRGILCHRADSLFDLSAVTTVIFDKTGTLENLESSLVCEDPREEADLQRLLKNLRLHAPHPVIDGLLLPNSKDEITDPPVLRVQEGYGVTADWPELAEQLIVGRASFVLEALGRPCAPGDIRTLVARKGRLSAEILPGEVFQDKALALLAELHQQRPDLRLLILSGDPKPLSGPLRKWVDRAVVEYRGDLKPAQKAELVPPNSLFVGDGLNDILALAQADVSLRVGGRARGYSAVDLELPQPNLESVPYLLNISRRFVRLLKQTAAMAAVYNLLAWTLAAFGWFTPLGAVCAMLSSLLLMTASASRLLRD